MSYESVDALTEALLDQAKRDRQRLIHEAEVRAQRIIAQAEGDALAQRAHIAEHAEEVAADLLREVKGGSRLEAQAAKVRKREALLDEVFRRAAEQLAEFDQRADYDEVVLSLVVNAVRSLGLARSTRTAQPLERKGGPDRAETRALVIFADETARHVLDEAALQRLEEELGIVMSLGEPLSRAPGQPPRLGVVVQTSDGHLRYDNTLDARLARMRGALRAATFRVLMGESQ